MKKSFSFFEFYGFFNSVLIFHVSLFWPALCTENLVSDKTNPSASRNVMTGFFCESAIKSAQKDHENTMDSRQEFRTLLTDIFNRLDDGDGQLTLAEFEKMFENEQMQAFLETAEITAADAWTLFASLDVDGDHVIDVDEFTKRCLTLRGGARSMDVFALTRQNLKIREQLNLVQQQLADLIVSVTLVDQRDIVSM